MADKKFSELDPVGSLTGTEILPVIKEGLPKRTTVADVVANYVLKSGDTMTGQLVAPSYDVSGAKILSSTGFPEGVVTAPVGSIYIDKAITNGVSSWIKKSGTGSTGWLVLEGDTGWRDITALFGSQLSTTYNPNDYGVYIRRKDEVVTINFKCAIGTGYSGSSVGMPAGFKAGGSSSNIALPFSILNLWQTAGSNTGQVQISTTFSFVVFTDITAGTRYYGSLTYIANDAYPSTLPGTAA